MFAVKPRVYAEITEETACIRDCKSKTRVQEEKVHKTRKTDRLRQTSLQSDSTKHTYPQTRHRNKRERAIQIH